MTLKSMLSICLGPLFFALPALALDLPGTEGINVYNDPTQVHKLVGPVFTDLTGKVSAPMGREIKALELKFKSMFSDATIRSIPKFALRGKDFNDADEATRNRVALISGSGGNFFAFNKETEVQSVDAFLGLLLGTSFSLVSYSRCLREGASPRVFFLPLDDHFYIPSVGGNDGISGRSMAATIPVSVKGARREYLVPNLDVGRVTHPSVPNGKGLILSEIPKERVKKTFGENGLPQPLVDSIRRWKGDWRSEMVCAAWIYSETLREIMDLARQRNPAPTSDKTSPNAQR